ncbi:hypothetical protein GOC48_24360 [Sinorhizobium meliloti]|nr:hypothetical protein [Sinorhizobium meliloti]
MAVTQVPVDTLCDHFGPEREHPDNNPFMGLAKDELKLFLFPPQKL